MSKPEFKPSFNFYESFGDVMDNMNSNDSIDLFWMIFNYGTYRILPEENSFNNKAIEAFYGHIKNRLDKDWEKYDKWYENNKG